MRLTVRRMFRSASVAVSIAALAAGAAPPRAGLLAPRPGPIDRPLSIAVADFDRDGLDDIVVADYQAAVLTLLVGRADGTFVPHPLGPVGVGTTTISNPTTGPVQVIAVDLDPEDVDADKVPNAKDNCPNSFNSPETDGTQVDANHNGIGDACEVGTDSNGDGIIDVTIDTDGDGIPDFDPVTLTLDNCPRRPNPGQEDTETAAGLDGLCGTADDNPLLYGVDAACGTADDRIGDGVGDACEASPDLLILTESIGGGSPLGALRVRMNTGEGGFVNRSSYSTSVGPGAIAVADYNRDGHLDLALTATPFKAGTLFSGRGDGLFNLPTFFNTGAGPQGVAWGDWDGDGDADLAIANRLDSTLSIFTNAGGSLPGIATATPATIEAPTVLLAGKLDAGPAVDLVVIGQGTASDHGRVQVFLGGLVSGLVAGQTIDLGAGQVPRNGRLADLDGNGTLDLALADFAGKAATVLSGVGDGTFTTPVVSVPLRDQATDLATIDLPPAGGAPALAVLQYNGRVDLLTSAGGFAYAPGPTTPASLWKDTQAMVFAGADLASAGDLVLLQGAAGRFDVLSGIGNNSFRLQTSQTLTSLTATLPADARYMTAADVSFNNRPDFLVVDPTAGKLVMVSNELTGVLTEQAARTIPTGAGGIGSGSLIASITDYDRDGVPNVLDDCPTIYNPPGCTVTDPACPRTIPCSDANLSPTSCVPGDPATTDPATGQCDSDRNGIGDHCQLLSVTCVNVDPDFDSVPQYDVNALKKWLGQNDFDGDTVPNAVDNCPTVANSAQTDTGNLGVGDACRILDGSNLADPDEDGVPTWNPLDNSLDNCPNVPNPGQEDNDNDRVGNACVIAAAIDNCPTTINLDQADTDGDGVGNVCATPPPDLLIPYPGSGEVTLLQGDGSGFLHEAAASPLDLLPGATAAVTGHFSLDCFFNACFSSAAADIAVAMRGAAAGSADDGVTVFIGDDRGGYVRQATVAAAGDPDALLVLANQSVCPDPDDPSYPTLRHDPDGASDLLVVTEPGVPDIRVLVGSNMNVIDPTRSPLVPPVGHPAPLPAPANLRSVASIDLNRDGLADLIAVAGPPGGPTRLQIFMGLGSGLFYTDPSLDPDPLNDDLALPAPGFIDIQTDSTYPDLALFSRLDQAPYTLLNILPERVDIDRSGRVDGFDVVALARAFGSTRGEDFVLQADGTFLKTGSGWAERLVGSGTRPPGQDLASAGGCLTAPVLLTGAYGLAVDINLDGVVDGVDLALLASRFGDTLP